MWGGRSGGGGGTWSGMTRINDLIYFYFQSYHFGLEL